MTDSLQSVSKPWQALAVPAFRRANRAYSADCGDAASASRSRVA